MHELSLCESLLDILENEAQKQHFNTIKTVWLEIGALSGIEIEAMRFSFDVVCKNTLAADAQLEIIEMPGQAWCFQCQTNITVKQRFDPCPQCGSHQLQVNDGEQMQIKQLEVE